MPSLKFRFIYSFLKLVGMRKTIAKQMITPPPRNPDWVKLPKKTLKGATTKEFETEGRKTVTIHPKVRKTEDHIVFYHGGGYVNEPHPLGMSFFGACAEALGARLSIMDYPLAPENNYHETHRWVLQNYKELMEKEQGPVVLAGDSAGGGLALAFAQILRDQDVLPKPKKLMLISPWVDLDDQTSLSDEVAKRDILLDRATLQHTSSVYANNEDKSQPILSPGLGELSGLGDISVWFGTEELFNRQIKNFVKKAKESGLRVTAYLEEKQQHNFPMVSGPEQRTFFKQAKAFLKN